LDDEADVMTLVRILAFACALPVGGLGLASLGLNLMGPDALERARGQALGLVQGVLGEGQATRAWAEAVEGVFAEPETYGSPFVCGALFGVTALLLGVALHPRRKPRAAPARQSKPPQASPAAAAPLPIEEGLSHRDRRRVLKTAGQIAQSDGAEAAGDFLLGHGLRDEAAKSFEGAGLLDRLAEVRHDQNRFEESADLYRKAERYEAAGAIYAQLERYEEAARCYLQADKRSVAGEMFERAGQYEEAGRCYCAIGFHRHAANAFLQAGLEEEAVRELVAVFNEEGGGRTTDNEQKQRDLRGVAKKAGKLLLKLGRLEEAESMLVRAGLYGAAARVAMQAEAFDRAAELFTKSGHPELAAEALDRAGDGIAAARLRGEHLRDQGHDEAAARYLHQAQEYEEAGDLYRRLERYQEAAECYAKTRDGVAAAEMFLMAGSLDRAADAYEEAGELEKAAECAEQMGDLARHARLLEAAERYFEAGRAYAAQERTDEAIRLLQNVPPEDPRYKDACAMLGSLFSAKGMSTLSIKKFEQAADGEVVSRANVEAYYELGRQLAAGGQVDRAAEIFEKILAFDYHYRDAGQLLDEAKESARKAGEISSAASAAKGASQRYELLRELGRGGMGVVYLARDTVLEREVAYKVLPEDLRSNPNALRNFLREAKAAAQLNHPHIVTVYDAGESEHGFYLAMEYVRGTTLKEILRQRNALPPGGVIYVLRQMAYALAFAHSKKVVHRDIKTANTMWTPEKQVKIMDFGLAKLMEEVRNATTLISGTPFYMSPEQTLGVNVDHRTDLYSLGVTVFELATGLLPFRKGNVPYHHVHTPPPDPRELNPRVPAQLAALILRLLEKDPAKRLQSANDVVSELARMGGTSGSAT
jgi:tetratricopeptide (TPR) repeat protein